MKTPQSTKIVKEEEEEGVFGNFSRILPDSGMEVWFLFIFSVLFIARYACLLVCLLLLWCCRYFFSVFYVFQSSSIFCLFLFHSFIDIMLIYVTCHHSVYIRCDLRAEENCQLAKTFLLNAFFSLSLHNRTK